MFDKRDIIGIYNNSIVGATIKCINPMAEDKTKVVEVEIIGKYPNFVRVSDGKTKWCVQWIDVLKLN